MVSHLSAVLLTQVTASKHGSSAVQSLPELVHYNLNRNEGRTSLYSAVYSPLGITAGSRLIHRMISFVLY